MINNPGVVQDENQGYQEEEKRAIEAVYEKQVTFIKSNCWKVWQPTDCNIRLRPFDSCLHDPEQAWKSNLSVNLHVKCSEEYPKRKPVVELLEPCGLSNEHVRNLLNILRQLADKEEGMVMIHTLSECVREYLTDHVSHPSVGSFHDDMLANKARTEAEKKKNSERQRHDTERIEMDLLEEEMRQRNAIELEKTLDGTRPEGETRIVAGRRIVVLSNIPVKRTKPANICHEWMGFCDNTQVLISEWTFRYTTTVAAKERDFKPFAQKLDSIVNEIRKLCEIKALDQNLVEYAFVHVEKISLEPKAVLVQLFVAQKISTNEENLEDTYELIVPKPNLLRLLAVQAICGLRYLHELSMTHKHLMKGSVWTRNSTGDCVFRFSDFGSMGPIIALTKLFNEICSGKYVPRDEEPEKEHDKRRKDLFQLGTLLDGLVLDIKTCGSNYSRVNTPTQSNPNSGTNLLSKFIVKCQEAKNIEQLVEDPFLKEECQESENIFTPFGGAMNPEGRMLCDNVIIRVLGKGGFGDVVLVRNKMDSTDYAIKRIPLNSGGEKVNRKIAKEAKYFAKLNHPNMVRYYNAWAEELIPIVETTSDDDSYMGAVPIPGKEKGVKKAKLKTGKSLEDKKDALGGGDSLMPMNLRALAQDTVAEAKEWSAGPKCTSRVRSSTMSSPKAGLQQLAECSSEDEESIEECSEIDWDAESEAAEDVDESSDDSDEEESSEHLTKGSFGTDSVFERSITSKSQDDDIIFTGESENEKEKKEDSRELIEMKSKSNILETAVARNPRILCIQMEYCDRQTLRQYIDEEHCVNNPGEVWRIFSEILCGLKYMHGMLMIHRDIKPLNIFLTSNGGVKIGDFGLATLEAMNTKGKFVVNGADRSASLEAVLSPTGARTKGSDVQQTRDIGTQLYMAPELFVDENFSTYHKVPYTSKIDIYSAGVVLFEMFYRPLKPGMERVSTINNLRDQIKIPESFGEGMIPNMRALARTTVENMLQKNADDRPTADDLLNDEDLPMHSKEDATFRSLAEKVIKKRDCRMNQWLLEKQFKEDVSTPVNYRYDHDICVDRFKNHYREGHVETLRAEFCKVFKVHSFEKVHTHTLMPVSTALAAATVQTQPAECLDTSGIPVALPPDLRQNFVRYCVRNSIQRLKRFNFGRIYSKSSKNGVHPNEKWECCVDSIGPQSSSTSLEAELLLVACEMISKALPGMKITLKIGHAQLLEAQVRHLKLSDDARIGLLNVLHLISIADRPPSHKEKLEMMAPKIGTKAANILTRLLIPVENNFNSFKEKAAVLRKKLTEDARELVTKAIQDLEEIMTTFKSCRTEEVQKISIVYDSQTCYRPRTFGDGLIFQIQVEKPSNVPNKTNRNQTVLAGGRYDSALLRERHPCDFVYEVPLCISGFGCPMDHVAQLRDHFSKVNKLPIQSKVLICSLVQQDTSNLIAEKFLLAKQFWNLKIEADVFHSAVEDLESLNTEPITFLKCDHECHEEIVRNDRLKQAIPNNQNQIFISSELATYETELDKLCRFQSCYMNCTAPVVKEMCGEEESKYAIEIVELYVQWHADDISDWHSITGNDETLPKTCQTLVKTHSKADDPILQIIGNVA
uniref:non-specific serine/threonine protein kinase n=1 Tax=Caenorhabditis tropicalis TaxID=1561998 RepID=A0A1I7UC66_9PELO